MGQKPYVVVIVDDHELFAEGLELLLTRDWGELFVIGGRTTFVEEASNWSRRATRIWRSSTCRCHRWGGGGDPAY